MKNENLLYKLENSVATITLDSPDTFNALTMALLQKLNQVFDEITVNEEIRVVIVAGHEKVFAAGADIKLMHNASPRQARNYSEYFHKTFDKIAGLPLPVIAAISGMAFGGGLELALACDLRIAAFGAKFAFPEINLGIIPGAGGTQRLTRAVGLAKAKEIIFSGEAIDAEEAKKMGLVNSVVPLAALEGEAQKLAIKLANKPKVAIAAAKKVISNGINVDLNTGNFWERECFASLFATEDQREGMKAFLEKRRPEFKGK